MATKKRRADEPGHSRTKYTRAAFIVGGSLGVHSLAWAEALSWFRDSMAG